MNQESKIRKNRKVAVVLSIVFSIIVLVGGSFAFFTASASKNNVNLVTADITNMLVFDGNDSKMKGELIPINEGDVDTAYQNNCLDSNNMNACSVYRFSIQNIAEVSQELIIKMIPTANSFNNLYYRLYEVGVGKVKSSTHLQYGDTVSNHILIDELNLSHNQEKIYDVVFFILNNEEVDQTINDADKNFGASIKVESIATGKYITRQAGGDCWDYEPLVDDPSNYKLTRFKGIYNDPNDAENYGKVREECIYNGNSDPSNGGVIYNESDDSYSIYIPSSVGGNNITTLSHDLFHACEGVDQNTDVAVFNKYQKIKNITINEGITTIENSTFDGSNILSDGTFSLINIDPLTFDPIFEDASVTLPSTLVHIGDGAFSFSQFNSILLPDNLDYIGNLAFERGIFSTIVIPKSVRVIGESSFSDNENLTSIQFLTESDGTSSLRTIGDKAFASCNLTYGNDPLQIPSSVTYIGGYAFYGNDNLLFIRFNGTATLGDNWNGSAQILTD